MVHFAGWKPEALKIIFEFLVKVEQRVDAIMRETFEDYNLIAFVMRSPEAQKIVREYIPRESLFLALRKLLKDPNIPEEALIRLPEYAVLFESDNQQPKPASTAQIGIFGPKGETPSNNEKQKHHCICF